MKNSIILLTSILLLSCSKPIEDSNIDMVFVVWLVNCDKEPTYATITTDKGIYTPKLIKIEDGSYKLETWSVEPDVHILKDLTLNNSEGITHYVPHGYDERATSWLDDFEYDLTYDRKFVFSVFCNL